MKALKYFVVFFLVSGPIYAQEAQEEPLPKQCDDPKLITSVYFSKMADAAQRVKSVACEEGSIERLTQAFDDYLSVAQDALKPFGGFANGDNPVVHVRRAHADGKLTPLIVYNPPTGASPDYELSYSDNLGNVHINPVEDEDLCTAKASTLEPSLNVNCGDVLTSFQDNYNIAHLLNAYRRRVILLGKIKALRKQWLPFMDHMKGQTPLELLANGWLFNRANANNTDYIAPPDTQLIILHPTVLIENVSGAIDGEQTEEALAVEAFGMNWWKNDKWYQPSGASVIAVYADRQGIDDWGYGVAVHFGGKYTMGVVDHGGETGVFVSIDFIKLFQDNDNVKKAYNIVFD